MKKMTVTESILIALAVVSVLTLVLIHWSFSFILLGIIGAILLFAAKQIPADPAHIAIPTLWGTPIRATIKARWAFALNLFPLLEDLILIEITKQEDEIVVENVRTRAYEAAHNAHDEGGDKRVPPPQSGGEVRAKIGLTYEVSQEPPGRAYDYITAGREAKVKDILNNIVEETMREEGSNRTWEGLSFSKSQISARLITLATGKNPEQRVKRVNGVPVRDTSGSHRRYLTESVGPDEELTELDYAEFLSDVLHNGYNDVHGLGIRIRRLNVMEITPQGELKKDAERLAREQQQRRAEEADMDTNLILAERIMEASNKGLGPNDPNRMTMEQALKEARIQRGRAQQVYVEGGSNRAAAIVDPNTSNPQGTNA